MRVSRLNVFKKKIRKLIGNKNIITNIYRMQAYNAMCRWFCTGFIDFMLKGKSLLEHTSLVSPDDKQKKMTK